MEDSSGQKKKKSFLDMFKSCCGGGNKGSGASSGVHNYPGDQAAAKQSTGGSADPPLPTSDVPRGTTVSPLTPSVGTDQIAKTGDATVPPGSKYVDPPNVKNGAVAIDPIPGGNAEVVSLKGTGGGGGANVPSQGAGDFSQASGPADAQQDAKYTSAAVSAPGDGAQPNFAGGDMSQPTTAEPPPQYAGQDGLEGAGGGINEDHPRTWVQAASDTATSIASAIPGVSSLVGTSAAREEDFGQGTAVPGEVGTGAVAHGAGRMEEANGIAHQRTWTEAASQTATSIAGSIPVVSSLVGTSHTTAAGGEGTGKDATGTL